MKKSFLPVILLSLVLLIGCKEVENTTSENSDTPAMITDVKASGKVEAIEISWTIPEGAVYSYVQINYTLPGSSATQTARALYPLTSWELTGLSEADGQISFLLLTVSPSGVRSASRETVSAAASDYAPPMVLDVTATAIAGGIQISWVNPDSAAGEFATVKIEYTDPVGGTQKTATVDYPQTSWILGELDSSTGELSFKVYTATSYGAVSETYSTVKATPLNPSPPATVTEVGAVPGEGTITLNWTNPDEEFAYVQVSYTDPRDGSATKGQTITQKVDYPGTSAAIIDLLARYGEITFTLSTFNAGGWQSEDNPEIKATADAVPPTVELQKTKINLTVDMLEANATVADGAGVPGLVDGDPATHYHTAWSGSVMPGTPHWIIIDLGDEPLDTFQLVTTARTSNAGGTFPGEMDVRVSNDKNAWTVLGTFYGKTSAADTEGDFPWEKGAVYTFPVLGTEGTPYRYIQYYAKSGTNANVYFCLGELELYKTWYEVTADPENE